MLKTAPVKFLELKRTGFVEKRRVTFESSHLQVRKKNVKQRPDLKANDYHFCEG